MESTYEPGNTESPASESTESSSSDSENDSLGDLLCSSNQESKLRNESPKHYVPDGAIRNHLTKGNVERELKKYDTKHLNSLVGFILNKATKVFAVTCLVFEGENLYKAIKKFKKESFTDQELPVKLCEGQSEADSEGNLAKIYYLESKLGRRIKPGKPLGSNNINTHLENIDLDKLPGTFKDAVVTARHLKVRYLWIDSICIIQGDGGDFKTESQQIENIFSSAYCVIAASRAAGQGDDYVTFNQSQGPQFYISRFIDNFTQDVLDGSLNQRGWVLQERALARRTIYFTETQTYWECGDGVRCETLTKMNNQLAAFLGDPNFPDVATTSSGSQQATSRGQQIIYYQDLYKKYSQLMFTRWEDRAVAMNGLEQRLSGGFNCLGRFGILDDSSSAYRGSLLHRSLLWREPGRN